IGGAENRAAARQKPIERVIVEHAKIAGRQQAVVAADDANGFPTTLRRRLRYGANHRIQTRAVATPGNYANSLSHDCILTCYRRSGTNIIARAATTSPSASAHTTKQLCDASPSVPARVGNSASDLTVASRRNPPNARYICSPGIMVTAPANAITANGIRYDRE